MLQIVEQLPLETAAAMTAILALWLIMNLRFNDHVVANEPTILTTVGIFATFVGIALGLSSFDTNDVEKSVPRLLDGLKLAFWASVCGVGAALLIKLRFYFLGVSAQRRDDASNVDTEKTLMESLRGIYWSLAGDSETTLVSQIKLMRSDMNDRLDALKKAQTESLKLLSEMGSKALIEALNDVIREFNVQLQEQFGENFKQLNQSVAQLLVWQVNYKTHVETREERLKAVVEQMRASAESYSELVNHAASFSKIASELQSLLASLSQQKDSIDMSLSSLANLLEALKQSIPQTEVRIIEFAKTVTDSASESHKSLSAAVNENAATMKKAIETAGEGIAKQQEEQAKRLSEMTTRIREQASLLEKSLEAELQKSLESLGRQLTALSAQFVEDYTPLTEKLRDVVRLAGRT